MYRADEYFGGNFKPLEITSYRMARRLLFLQLNTAPLVSPIVEQKTTSGDPAREKNVTIKNNTNQNTTRTTQDLVRRQVLLATKGADSLIHPMDDDSHR